jgi:hypothetical protein
VAEERDRKRWRVLSQLPASEFFWVWVLAITALVFLVIGLVLLGRLLTFYSGEIFDICITCLQGVPTPTVVP